MGAGGLPVDLILFGMIAAFLVLRLRSILGRRTGYERPPEQRKPQAFRRTGDGQVIDGQVVPDIGAAPRSEPPPVGRTLPDPASPLGQTLQQMQSVDRDFDPARFLNGAEAAFRMVVDAFAAGNRQTLRPLLSDDTYAAFDGAITAREAAGETQRSEIKAITDASIMEATLRGSLAVVTVRFTSDQISMVVTRDNSVVSGADAVTELVDLWTFERDLHLSDPTWRLIAARSA